MRNRVPALLDCFHLAFIAEHLFIYGESFQGCEEAWLCLYADQVLLQAYSSETFPLTGNSPVAMHASHFIDSYSQMLVLIKLLEFLTVKTRFGVFKIYLKHLCFLNLASTLRRDLLTSFQLYIVLTLLQSEKKTRETRLIHFSKFVDIWCWVSLFSKCFYCRGLQSRGKVCSFKIHS